MRCGGVEMHVESQAGGDPLTFPGPPASTQHWPDLQREGKKLKASHSICVFMHRKYFWLKKLQLRVAIALGIQPDPCKM